MESVRPNVSISLNN